MPKIWAIPVLHPAAVMRQQELAPLMAYDLLKSTKVPPERYNLFATIADIQEFAAKNKVFCFDIETNRFTQEIKIIGLTAKDCEALVVPFHGQYISELKKLFAQATEVVGQNCIQFDLPILENNGVKIGESTIIFDVMLMQHLCFPSFPHDLEFIGSQFVSKPAWKDDKVSFETYCARDVDVTWQSWGYLKHILNQNRLMDLYLYTQVPLAKICRLMHETGIKIDGTRIAAVREQLLKDMAELELALPEKLRTQQVSYKKRIPAPEGTLSEKTGKPVKFTQVDATKAVTPWRSKQVVERYLYEELALPAQAHLHTGRVTTGKDAMERLYKKTKNPSIQAIQRLRKLDEMVTTFCKESMTDVKRMHPHFNVHGTVSGRLSSSDPNLQNIPEAARVIYVPSHVNWKLIEVDYSGIENRLTAYMANDHERLQRFVADPKFSEHKQATSVFFGIPYDEVIKDNDKDAPYGKAKRIVHGTNYGMGANKIAKLYDLDIKEVKDLITKWKETIKETSLWQNRCGEQAKKQGYLRTPFNRMRWFYTSSYFTEALSFLPQSSAADVIFRAMIGLMYERIKWPEKLALKVSPVLASLPEPARLLLQVHDALVFEAPQSIVEETVRRIKLVLEQPWKELGGMSFPVAVKIGDSWWECK